MQFLLVTQVLQLQSKSPAAVYGVQTRSLLQTADQLLFGLEDHSTREKNNTGKSNPIKILNLSVKNKINEC